MHRLIDLDAALKDRDSDSLMFTLTIGGEKYGLGTDEVVELIRAKAAAPGKGGRRTGGKGRAQFPSEAAGDAQGDEGGVNGDADANGADRHGGASATESALS